MHGVNPPLAGSIKLAIMFPLPPDITAQIERDFVKDEVAPVLDLLGELSVQNNGPFDDRIMRCVVYLSCGTFSGLTRAIGTARADFRDVISFAEYDANDERLRDLCQPFNSDGYST